MNNCFIPCKVLDSEWANKLLDGEVFMRPLSEFGVHNLQSDIKDAARRDTFEGNTFITTNINDIESLKGLDPNFKDIVSSAALVDYGDLQYFKLFCLYCLEIDEGNYKIPDPRMAEFGDSVIVFRDFNEFLRRFGLALIELFDDEIILLDRVGYYYVDNPRHLTPMFDKTQSYAYQNELRLAVAEAKPFKEKGQEFKKIVLSNARITVNVGNIRDIAYKISMTDFLSIKGIVGKHFPPHFSNNDSLYDYLVESTREEMKNYSPYIQKSQLLIYKRT